MLRLLFAILCAAAACMLVAGAFSSAQTTASTPDAFIAQITNKAQGSFATDMSANGRFIVFESNGDAATLKPGEAVSTKNPTNNDGNSEIFIYDYAQRRIFQLTRTASVLNPSPSPSPSPSPTATASPTASPSPTPILFSSIKILIDNRRPVISSNPALSSGSRTYTIVFSSNAPNPGNFDGTDPGPIAADGGRTLSNDANMELWKYEFTVSEVADLSQGADTAFQDLSAGTFTRITSTPASRAPLFGSATQIPSVADDNNFAAISEDGQVIAFESSRDLVAGGNTDTGAAGPPNNEIFLFRTGTFTQVTNTRTTNVANSTFNNYPTIVGSGAYTFAFYSNADLVSGANADLNAEVFMANFNGVVVSNLRQVTRTRNTTATGVDRPANNFSYGRRLSRDGRYLAFESLANDPADSTKGNADFLVTFVHDSLMGTGSNAFAQLGPRPTSTTGPDVNRFPTFTDDAGGSPTTVLFSSFLNFNSSGTLITASGDTTGLNSAQVTQVFATSLPVMGTGPFRRLTNITGTNVIAPINTLPSNTFRRLAFSMGGAELGGGNPDFGAEVFYNLVPAATTDSTATISVFTGASLIPVASPSPTASGSPSPSPSPSPSASPSGPLVAPGLAPGELAQINSSASLAPSAGSTSNASEEFFAPPLPIELRGVSVSIRGAAAGLYAVNSTTISFVVPKGLPTGVYPLVINNNGTVIRGNIAIVAAQPDIFTSSAGAGGRATVFDVTNPGVETAEPFTITATTTLRVVLTGVHGVSASQVSIRVGTTDITGTGILSNAVQRNQPGFYQIDFRPPTTLAGAGDVPIIVTVTIGGATFTSRPADSAPLIRIN